jgi:hypothetical protein
MRFRLQVFSWFSFLLATEYHIGAISNIYENSRRYLKLKVFTGVKDIGEKWEKFWVRKFFRILLRSCWVAVYIHILAFDLMFTLRCRQADIVQIFSSPVSLTPSINYHAHQKRRLTVFPSPAGCHVPNSPWPGIKLLPARESLVSDIPAGDGKTANLFLQCTGGYYRRCSCHQQWINRQCHGIDENPGKGLINHTGNNLQ